MKTTHSKLQSPNVFDDLIIFKVLQYFSPLELLLSSTRQALPSHYTIPLLYQYYYKQTGLLQQFNIPSLHFNNNNTDTTTNYTTTTNIEDEYNEEENCNKFKEFLLNNNIEISKLRSKFFMFAFKFEIYQFSIKVYNSGTTRVANNETDSRFIFCNDLKWVENELSNYKLLLERAKQNNQKPNILSSLTNLFKRKSNHQSSTTNQTLTSTIPVVITGSEPHTNTCLDACMIQDNPTEFISYRCISDQTGQKKFEFSNFHSILELWNLLVWPTMTESEQYILKRSFVILLVVDPFCERSAGALDEAMQRLNDFFKDKSRLRRPQMVLVSIRQDVGNASGQRLIEKEQLNELAFNKFTNLHVDLTDKSAISCEECIGEARILAIYCQLLTFVFGYPISQSRSEKRNK